MEALERAVFRGTARAGPQVRCRCCLIEDRCQSSGHSNCRFVLHMKVFFGSVCPVGR